MCHFSNLSCAPFSCYFLFYRIIKTYNESFWIFSSYIQRILYVTYLVLFRNEDGRAGGTTTSMYSILYFYSFLGNWKENHVSMQLIALKHSPPFVSLFGSFFFCFSVFMMCLWWNSTEPKCNDSSGPFVTKQQFRFRPLTSNPHSRKLDCLYFLFPICLWFYLFVCFLSPICLCGATIMVESYHNDSSDPFVQQ